MKKYKITTYKGTYTITADSYLEAEEILKVLEPSPQVMSVMFIK
jgi:hypothetical protein